MTRGETSAVFIRQRDQAWQPVNETARVWNQDAAFSAGLNEIEIIDGNHWRDPASRWRYCVEIQRLTLAGNEAEVLTLTRETPVVSGDDGKAVGPIACGLAVCQIEKKIRNALCQHRVQNKCPANRRRCPLKPKPYIRRISSRRKEAIDQLLKSGGAMQRQPLGLGQRAKLLPHDSHRRLHRHGRRWAP